MSEPFLAEIRMVGFNFAPRGWSFCDGQILPINQNQSLYSLLGTTYGGDGRTSFGLPDLRGRIPFHVGGTGYAQGQKAGEENHPLTVAEMPSHGHAMRASQLPGDSTYPAGNLSAQSSIGDQQFSSAAANSNMRDTNATGGGQGHNNMPPFLAVNFCIAILGLFPSRN